MSCICAYDVLRGAFHEAIRLLRQIFCSGKRSRRNKRRFYRSAGVAVGRYRAPQLRPDPHPHLPRDRLQEHHPKLEITTAHSCSHADEAQDDSDADNTDEGEYLCLTG